MKNYRTYLFDLQDGMFKYHKEFNTLLGRAGKLMFEDDEAPTSLYITNSKTENQRKFYYVGFENERFIYAENSDRLVFNSVNNTVANDDYVRNKVIGIKNYDGSLINLMEDPSIMTVEVPRV